MNSMDSMDDDKHAEWRDIFKQLVDLDDKYKRDVDALQARMKSMLPLSRLVCYVADPSYRAKNKYYVLGVFATRQQAEAFGMRLCDEITRHKNYGDPDILLKVEWHEIPFNENKQMVTFLDTTAGS